MKILFVVKSKQIETLGVMHLAAVAKQCGHEAKIADIGNALSTKCGWKPDIVGMSIMTGDMDKFRNLAKQIRIGQKPSIIVGGSDVTFFPQGYDWADVVIQGEAEQVIADLLQSDKKYSDLDSIPHPDRTDFPNMKIRDFIASRGCTNSCLTGNTIIHTIEGPRPIKDLVGLTVKVLTRNPITQEPLYADAFHIRRTREMSELVRVHFDDDSHIDCTPDHKFKAFGYKNQFNPTETEQDVEAKDLIPKQQVRAVSFSVNADGRIHILTRRKISIAHAQMVLEAAMGRKLLPGERAHHKDRNPGNDSPDNLVSTTNQQHIPDWHPEVSERMKRNNPVRNIPREVLSARAKKTFNGRKQSLKERLMRREMQLGENNSNYKSWVKHIHAPSRMSEVEINHKVATVEKLPYREDVYCMEVPSTGWFYANKVLVHNCAYCYNSAWNKLYPELSKIRYRSAKNVIREVTTVQPEFAYFQDSTFGVSMKWLKEFCIEYSRKLRIPFHVHLRPNMVIPERVQLLADAGCVSVKIALETSSSRLRKLINRGKSSNEDVYIAARLLRREKIALILQNILGLPTATIEDDLNTLEVNIKSRPAYSWSSIFQPYPGTVLAEYCEKEKIYTGDYSEIGDNFFDKSVLNISEEHKEQIACLQRVFAFCTEIQVMPEISDLTWKQLPKFIHNTMRKVGDRRMFPNIIFPYS